MLKVAEHELKVKHSKLGKINIYLLICASYPILKPFSILNKIIFHVEFPPTNVYKKKLRMGHVYNITINSNTILGENITLHHNVTIGSKQWGKNTGAPNIEDNVIIYPHSIIIGNITVGKNSIIGGVSCYKRRRRKYYSSW